MSLIRAILLALVAALSLSALYAIATSFVADRPSTQPSEAVRVAPFHLVDQYGRPVTQADVAGRPAVFFFGFTYCPEICPTTLASLTAAIAKLGPAADRIGFYFVTVDPDRDTPALLKEYMAPFDQRIRALTGDGAQVAALAHGLGIFFQRSGSPDSTYTVDHTASVLFIDAAGRPIATLPVGENPEAVLDALHKIDRSNPQT